MIETFENEELHSIMPHRGKMLLIKRVTAYDVQENTVEAEGQIEENCIFFDREANGIPAFIGFEFVAQTVSALIGIKNRERPSSIGLIMSISNMNFTLPIFRKDSIISIKAREVDSMASVHVFSGEIYFEGKKVLEGKLTVMDVDDEMFINKEGM